MKYANVVKAIEEAKRFIAAAKLVKAGVYNGEVEPGRDSAAARRASLDLSIALATMRNGKCRP